MYGFHITGINSINNINQSIFVMVKYCVFFEVRTEFLNNISTNLGFEGLKKVCIKSA
jgi:hypothetical protein